MNRSREHALVLMDRAADDQYVLERLAEDDQAPDAIIGFHAQQAIEKSLKAVLTSREIHYGRTHNLRFLIDLLLRNQVDLPPEADRLPVLTPYAVQFRYEPPPEEPTGSVDLDRDWAVGCVRQVRDWAAGLTAG